MSTKKTTSNTPANKNEIRLEAAVFKNIRGFGVEDQEYVLEFPGKINVLRGSNAAGKSGVIHVIKQLTEQKMALQYLTRDNAGDGKALFIFDDKSKVDLTVEKHKASKVMRDQTDVDQGRDIVLNLFHRAAFDPTKWLTDQNWKYRLDMILRAYDFKITPEEWKALDVNLEEEGIVYKSDLDFLEFFDLVEDALKKIRTTVNREIQDGEAFIKKTTPTLVEPVEGLQEKLVGAEKELEQIVKDAENEKADVRKKHESRQQAIDSELDKIKDEIERLRQKMNDLGVERKSIDGKIDEEIAAVRKKHQDSYDAKKSYIDQLKNQKERESANAGVRKMLEQQKNEVERNEKKRKTLNDKLKALLALKKTKMDTIPIEGLSIGSDDKEKNIFINNIPFPELNTAKKSELFYKIAIRSADLFAKETDTPVCRLIVGDNIESLDNDTMKVILEDALKNGFKVLLGEVSWKKEPLHVESYDDVGNFIENRKQ